ncbi:MAG: DSD1 family PLP-dependent enzyme [Rhodospirillales bacterium]
MDASPNQALVGTDGSRLELSTPALVIDMATFKANLRSGQDIISNNGIGLRPPIRTHRSLAVAKLQMKTGAKGICCETVAEAEVLADGGIAKITLTRPPADPAEIERLAQLNTHLEELMVVVDDLETVKALQEAARQVSKKFRLLIDVDIDGKGSGIANIEDGVAMARFIAEAPELRFFGLQAVSRRVQHIAKSSERRQASHAQLAFLKALKKAIKDEKMPVRVTTGSGTGSHLIDMEAAVYNDIQLATYCFMDGLHQGVHIKLWGQVPYHPALFVYSRVLGNHEEGYVTLDAGSKSLPSEGPLPTVVSGAPDGSRYEPLSEEFGKLILPEGVEGPVPGSLVVLQAPDCAATVQLYDSFHCVRDDKLAAIWPITVKAT